MIGALLAKTMAGGAFRALERHDLTSLMKHIHDDIVWFYPTEVSVGGEHRGRRAVEDFFIRWLEQFPKVRFNLRNKFVSNLMALGLSNTLAVEWDVEITTKDGVESRNEGVTVFVVKGGKAIRVTDYVHHCEALRAAWGETATS